MFQKIKSLFEGRSKGYSLTSLWVAGLGFVITVIVLAVGGKIVGKMQAGETENSTVWQILQYGIDALKELGGWLPIIAMAVAGVLILLLIVRAFGGLGFVVRRGE